ncbi:MAG TPA: FKBP-type peptidyl-prolyl cis-trans isomerase [Opitutaceae bacterium]|nr:FKBP-type peptidyl-prolyl cis-trans isomerase [Opitutaceae bacterium]
MRSVVVLTLLALLLAFIAWQARTGIFRLKNPGEPANKYVRQQQEARDLAADEARLIADKFPGAIVTPSGLRYIVRAPGEGSPPPVGAEVSAHYHGTLLTGQKFDSSHDRGTPYTFRVGRGEVIKGWDEAFAGMKRGERRTLVVPWWLAYGETGRPPRIPARATLVFEVELVGFR